MTFDNRGPAMATVVGVLMILLAAARAETVVEVRCKPHHFRVETPVMLPVRDGADLPASFSLVEEGTARRIPAQVITEPAGTLCFIMPPRIATNEPRRFRVTNEKPDPKGFAISDADKDRIEITEGGRGVAAFVRGAILKPGVPGRYRRSCYLHPVYDLDGAVLTDDFPRDHFHHRGMSWAWPRVEAAGKRYDLWAVGDVKDRFGRVLSSQAGPVCAVLRVADRWVAGEHEQPLVDEILELCIWRAGSEGRAMDVFITLTAPGTPVTIGGQLEDGKGYGGFNVRFAPRQDTHITGPDGRQPDNVNCVRMTWSDLSGQFTRGSETISGLAIFDSPGNPHFPNGWSNRAYGYLNPAWPGLDKFELKTGVPLRLRYRVWIHRGDATAGKVALAQQVFVDLPEARLLPVP
jgi:hypothetical protein